jgi:flagellar assembly protein FliH
VQRLTVKFKSEFDDLTEDEIKHDELELKLQQHYDSGYSEGYGKAKSELEKSFNDRLLKKFGEFNLILKTVDDKISAYDDEFETLIVQLSFKIAAKIVRREINSDSNIESALKESLRKVLGANNIIIKLHPEDHKRILTKKSQSVFIDESISKIKFEEDERIEKGGCIVETEIGNVDARISSQLEELEKYFEPNIEA